MPHEKWFTSDTHFFHNNILTFKYSEDDPRRYKSAYIRCFASMDEMNETIIERWNKNVKPQDYVYHLGDVTFQYHKPFNELMSRLNGHKRLIVGNHDKIKQPALHQWFDKIDLWKGFKEEDFTITHIPLRLESLRDGHFNVHGHTHQNSLPDPHYINVCVEVRDYTPVHMDTILQEIKVANTKFNN